MKVSLVSPPTTVIERYPENHPLRKGIQITEPLGLAYLAAMIEDLAEVNIVDCVVEDLNIGDCAKRVAQCDIVGISVVSANIHIANELAAQIKIQNPNILNVFGGIHPSLRPHRTLQNPNVDILVIGEGEYNFRKIVEDQPLNKIEGVAYRENNKVKVNPPNPLEKDLDKFSFPARHLLLMEKYKPFLYLRNPTNTLISSRGCPYTCVYCCRDISGTHYRVRKPEKVVEEIKLLVDIWGSKEVDFQDPLFGASKKWVKTFCTLLKKEKLDVVWSALTRVNFINKESLKQMKESGAWMLYYGIEAGNQQLLDNIKKQTNLMQIRKAVKLTREAGIKTWGSFMYGLPGETPESAQETLDFSKDLGLDFASYHLTTPYIGTELRENYKEYGIVNEDEKVYTQLNPVFVPFGWVGKEEELKKFFTKSFNSFYLQPSYIIRQFLKIRSWEEVFMYLRGLKVI